jgi:hypothetical protein
MSIHVRIVSVFISVLLLFVVQGCYKEKPTVASIKLLRASDSTAVNGAELRLYYDGSTRLDALARTNSTGIAEVDYTEQFKAGQSGFAVLDVDLVIGDSVVEPLIGTIKIEQEKKSQQTIFCTRC